jgi:transposase
VKKDAREIMEILEAFDATGCAHSAAPLAGCDPKTVRHWVARRDQGLPVPGSAQRPRLIDPFLDQIEDWVDRSKGQVRADVVHERLVVVGFTGDERTTRRAVAEAKDRWRAGHRRTYRPWITEPGMWCQFDWGAGPMVPFAGGGLRATLLFCFWLAWSRFRVVIPTWDRTLPTLLSCVDTALRRAGGAPTYALTDNEKTVTVEQVARIPVRHPEIVAAGRHYGMQVATCVPFDPESKGGSEATVRVAKADLVPTEANLAEAYPDMTALIAACDAFCAQVNTRVHRETAAAPVERLVVEQGRLHVLPAAHIPPRWAKRGWSTPTRRCGSGRCVTPPHPGWSSTRCGSAPPGTNWSSSRI